MDDEALMRCRAAVIRALGGGGDADLDEAVAEIHSLPPDHAERGTLAASLILALMRTSETTAPQRMRHMDGLVEIADHSPPPGLDWPRLRCGARALAILYAGTQGKITNLGAALAELDTLAATAGDEPAARALLDSARMGLTFLRAMEEGNETALRRMPGEVAKLGQMMPGHPAVQQLSDFLVQAADVVAANQRGDHGDMWRAFDRLQESTRNLPPDHHLRDVVAQTTVRMQPFRGLDAGDGESILQPTEEQLAQLVDLTDRPDATAAERVLSHLAAGGALLGGWHETDPKRIDASVEHFRKAVELAADDDPQRAFYLQSLALGLFRRTEVTGTVADLDEITHLLEQARDLLGGPAHPQWSFVNEMLSAVRQRRGENPQAGDSGLDGQRGYAWRVLLQSDTAGATIAIKNAARDAIDVARRCLGDNNPADALRALDSGRGLMLFAATEFRHIAANLDAAGRPDLARRWQASTENADTLPDDLRREMLTVLTEGAKTSASLLDPPSLAEIQLALSILDADALVYLVPGEPPLPGLAIIAPVDGRPSYMALPNLVIEEDVDVERYLTALADRSRDLAPSADRSQFAGSLATLCDWAWRAAIGPLLERYVASRPPPASGRVPRLVLVPMGDLARIPWQAARRKDGTYAVQLAAFSHAASARMLCNNASLAPVPLSPAGLVVGDPDTGGRADALYAARLEAHAIRRAFYRGARYVGRRPDGSASPSGAGTADQVRDWLANRQLAAGAMLHLACHGSFRADSQDAKSYLLLAKGESSRQDADELSAEELIEVMAKAPQHHVGLVVLAACHTGRSIHGYDEAYSLGTAFLAGGARTVLSTQWSIPDATTSSLMFMFHHYLKQDALTPWQALRQAQMWMLDPQRQPPRQMPAPLRPLPSATDHAEVVAWAGFVHWGQ